MPAYLELLEERWTPAQFADRLRAAERGVSIQAISRTVNAMVGGVVAGQYSSGQLGSR